MDDVLTLIKSKIIKDEYDIEHEIPYKRQVFCGTRSIRRAEFFNAGRSGLNPSFEFLVFHGDYEGETICEYRDNRYSIYRTYEDGDYIELYAERKGGTNAAEESNS